LSEVFVGPKRLGAARFAEAQRKIYDLPRMTIVPLDHGLAELTASVRAGDAKLQTPDAAVVATARAVGASRILTTDSDFRRVVEAETLRQFNRAK
jgi:predicted nucleic acid-binding protein